MGGGKICEMGTQAPDVEASLDLSSVDLSSVDSAAEAKSISDACDAYAAHSHAEEGQGTGTPDALDATGEQVGELHAKGMAAAPTVDTWVTAALCECCEDEGGVACGGAATSTVVADSSAAPAVAPPEQSEAAEHPVAACGSCGVHPCLCAAASLLSAHEMHVERAVGEVCLGAHVRPGEISNQARSARAGMHSGSA